LRRIATGVVIVILLTAFVALELNNLYSNKLSSASPPSTLSSSAQKSTGQPALLSIASDVSTNGLQLKMTLNSSAILSHRAVGATFEVINTLNQNVSAGYVPAWNQTIPPLNLDMKDLNDYDFTCSGNPSSFLVDYAVVAGHYSAENVSSAGPPLMQRTLFGPPCPGGFPDGSDPVTFLPNGDQAIATYNSRVPPERVIVTTALNATTFYCASTANLQPPGNCGAGQGLVGYWNPNVDSQGVMDFSSPAFTYFPAGEYTIVAFDAWNQYLYATFEVQ